jgi:hypothetical protein
MLNRRTTAGISALVASAGLALGVLTAIPAHADDEYPPRTSTTIPSTTTVPTEVLGETAENVAASTAGLPVTGGDLLGLVAMGGAAALGGAALVRFSRTRSEA